MLRSNSGFPVRAARPALVAVHNIRDWGDMPCVANRCSIAAEFAAKSTSTDRCILQVNGPRGPYVKETTTAGAVSFLGDMKDLAWLIHRLDKMDRIDWPQHLRVWGREHRHVVLRAEYEEFLPQVTEIRHWLEDDAVSVLFRHNATITTMVRCCSEMRAVRS